MRRLRPRVPSLRGGTVRQQLLRHLCFVLALTAVAVSALFVSYDVVHRTPAKLQADSAPAVQEVVAARVALVRADEAVDEAYEAGLTDVVGPGEEYQTQIAAAGQSLSQIADRQLTGDTGRRTLEIVNPLLVVYNTAVYQAIWQYADAGRKPAQRPAAELMREQKLAEADSVLYRVQQDPSDPDKRIRTGIVPRLNALQAQQLDVVAEETRFGTAQYVGWAVAWLALLGLVACCVSALLVLRRRCGRRYNVWLSVAALLALALAAGPAKLAYDTQQQLDKAYTALASFAYSEDKDAIEDGSAQVQTALAGTAWRTRGAPYAVMAVGCGLTVGLASFALGRRLTADYGS